MVPNSIGAVKVGQFQFVFNAPRTPRPNGIYFFDFRIEPQEELDKIRDGTELEGILEVNLPAIYTFVIQHLREVGSFRKENYYAYWALFHDRPLGQGSNICIKPLALNVNKKPLDPCQYLTFRG